MKSYLQRLAHVFVREVGDTLPQYTFVFPNHRAGLFFRRYLSESIESPLFAPKVQTINECFAELSDLRLADPLTLLVRLYALYAQQRPNAEPLEQFLHWGRMMLSDFSEIDNHLVANVEALFSAVHDWHEVEDRFTYLTDAQRAALSRFWREFLDSEEQHPDGVLHDRFVRTWELLYPLYTGLREGLLADGLAYDGLLHREVIESFDAIPEERLRPCYVFVGFNALTESERQLMLRLQSMGRADFYFDYESAYLQDLQNCASLFMADNKKLFHSRYVLPEAEDMSQPECTLIEVSSTVGEAYEVHHILQSLYAGSTSADFTHTAVVLPDEQLLIPLLSCFPPEVRKINVTMGYPLRATSLYMPVAYPEQFFSPMPQTAAAFVAQMRSLLTGMRTKENAEGVYQLVKVLDRIESVMAAYPQVVFSVDTVQQVLRMLTLETSIPYVGEPLDGLQVMGVLETRALDFDNLIITGFNDDLYPGHTKGNSFVPYVLRRGFGLPTSERQDAIFAYNFYRMLSYARHVWFITNSTADEQHSGEVSRYLYQLQWQYGVDIEHETVVSPLVVSAYDSMQAIEKTDEMLSVLSAYAQRGMSATALNQYMSCPKQFYYRHIAGIHEPPEEEDVTVADNVLGEVLHATIQELYQPFEGKNVTSSDIDRVQQQFDQRFTGGQHPLLQDLQGDILAEQVVRSYVNNILEWDKMQAPFVYVASEQAVRRVLTIQGVGDVWFYGKIDRVDVQGTDMRVIDYKTGAADLVYTSMPEVFARKKVGQQKVFQTLLYCWLLEGRTKNSAECAAKNTVPHIYPVRRLTVNEDGIQTFIRTKQGEQKVCFADVRDEFVDGLQSLLQEMFDKGTSFDVTEDKEKVCKNCPFTLLCR